MQDILDTKEAAAYIKHAVITLEQWRAKDFGPKWYQPANKVLYYKDDLDAWVKSEAKQND